LELPQDEAAPGRFLLSTRRGKQFNSIIQAQVDGLNGASRDSVLMAAEDAQRLGLADGASISLRNELGEFRGRVKIDRIKAGCLQAYWPEVNAIVPSGRLDPSGVPDYTAEVEVVYESERGTRATEAG
jgi:anaerobic selenocysteine-containing dehydrogenase